jgi:lysophospholipase L1-like esterase
MKKWIVFSLAMMLAGCKISVFGDSNTASNYPGPTLINKWVQKLAALRPTDTFIEHGIAGRRLVDLASPDGLADMDAKVIADNANVIGIALGEADAIEITLEHETLTEAQVAIDTILLHISVKFPVRTVVMALIPPAYGFTAGINPVGAMLNAYIQSKLPANRIVDFASIALSEDTYDGLHFCGDPFIPPCTSGHGQDVRAAAANAAF